MTREWWNLLIYRNIPTIFIGISVPMMVMIESLLLSQHQAPAEEKPTVIDYSSYQRTLPDAKPVSEWQVCQNYSPEHSGDYLDAKHEERFSNSVPRKSDLSRTRGNVTGNLRGCHTFALWISRNRYGSRV